MFKQTTEKFGPVDVLINNAGMQTKTMDAYDKIVAVNMVSIPTIFFFFNSFIHFSIYIEIFQCCCIFVWTSLVLYLKISNEIMIIMLTYQRKSLIRNIYLYIFFILFVRFFQSTLKLLYCKALHNV